MNSNFCLSLTLGCVMWPELFRKGLEAVPKPREPVNFHRVRIVPALVLEPDHPRVDAVSEPFRNYLRTVSNPRESLEHYQLTISPTLGSNISSQFRNFDRFPQVKPREITKGRFRHVQMR
jgi:hypothetical protein